MKKLLGLFLMAWLSVSIGAGTPSNSIGLVINNSQPLPQSLGGSGNTTGQPGGSAGGDLTGSYPSPAVTSNAITYAKFQQIVANSLFGNPTGSTANGQPISLGSTLTFSGTALQTLAMSGDISTPANSFVSTLATVNSSPGSYGSATQVPQITVNGKGLATSVSNVTISGVTPGGAAGGGLSGTYPNPTVSTVFINNSSATGFQYPVFVPNISGSQPLNVNTSLAYNPASAQLVSQYLMLGASAVTPVSGSAITQIIDGNDSTAAFLPELGFFTNVDTYPLMVFNSYAHGNNTLCFECYYDTSGVWRSSYAGSNFQIQDLSNVLAFNYASGNAQGASITWTKSLGLTNSGAINVPLLTASEAVVTNSSDNLASLAYTNANTASTLVQRDSSGNFSAGTVTATLSGNATTSTTATNANNVATTQVSNNASYYPLLAPSSTNSNQAPSLGTGITFNPSTNVLNTVNVQATGSLQVGTTTNNAPLTVQGNGGTTGPASVISYFSSPASATAGNLYAVLLNKSGTDSLLLGINKNSTTGTIPSNGIYISSYQSNSTINIGRGAGNGLPSNSDLEIDSSGNIDVNNGNLLIQAAGKNLQVKSGVNACIGTQALSGASTTVNTSCAVTGDLIFFTITSPGGTPGVYSFTISNGVSFTVTSSTGALDISTVGWFDVHKN